MPFFQDPPRLGNQFDDDPLLPSWIARHIPEAHHGEIATELHGLGDLAVEYYGKQLLDRENEPVLTQWDAWGNRIDRIEVTPLWKRAAQIAAEAGLIAIPYERAHGRYSRIHQFAAVYLFHPSSDVYTCPLAMTDGAARTLTVANNRQLIERAHARGLKIFGCTLTPVEGFLLPGTPFPVFTPAKEVKRQAVNTWIRTSGEYDDVIDFDRVLREPSSPTKIRAVYDSGDHGHPNDLGYHALANAIDLKLFSKRDMRH